jgi:diguanylate cyclase (GGDEF)-like protein/PAS domain S-box-containing protein
MPLPVSALTSTLRSGAAHLIATLDHAAAARPMTAEHARSQDIPFWLGAAAYALLTCGVLIALVALHGWSDQKQAASQAVSALRTTIAVEQEAVLDPVDTRATLLAQADLALAQVRASDASDPAIGVITTLTHNYEGSVSLELAGLRANQSDSAAAINASVADARFTVLDAALDSESTEEAASASSGVTIAFAASIAMVIGEGVLLCLFALFARRRRHRIIAVEAIADQLAHDAGIAATRAETFRTLFDENPQPMLVTRLPAVKPEHDVLQFLSVNNAALEMYGYTRAEFLELHLADIRPPEDRALLVLNLDSMRRGCAHFENIRHQTKAGVVLDIEIDTRETIFDGQPAMIICPNDVTDRVRLARELEHQAFHDPLTGLPNRSLFRDRLEHAHARLERIAGCYAVLMLDLDNFKSVNDSLGHAAGDDLLTRVSERLKAEIRSGNTAARLGGDEFAILLEDLANPSDAAVAADSLRAALRRPFLLAGRSLTITATIGVATSSGKGAAADVARNADVALYVGKADGKDRHAVFTDTMYVAAVERMTLEQDLRAGIARGELLLLYQPKVDAQTSTLTGVEALVRWQHPTRGVIAPDVFIPIAEQSGLINDVDAWVLAHACRQAQQWATSGIAPVPVAVNVSGRSLANRGLLERVVDALQTSGLDPRLLELEVTESAAIPQHGQAFTLLQAIRDLGVRIAIDDFGTGYSVLSRLQGFPVDTLKIDLSFTRAIVSERQEAPIVDAMIAMGLSLGLKIVAEGVETDVQRRYLARRHCSELQGYLISRPVAPEEVVERFSTPRILAASV